METFSNSVTILSLCSVHSVVLLATLWWKPLYLHPPNMASLAQFSKISAMPNDWSIYEKSRLIGFQVYNGGLNQISDEFLHGGQSLLRAHPPPTNIPFPSFFCTCKIFPQIKSPILSSKLVKVRSRHIFNPLYPVLPPCILYTIGKAIVSKTRTFVRTNSWNIFLS